MANEFYATSGSPATSSQGSSATMRSEFTAIAAGFDKLPILAGNGSKLVQVNSGGSALTAVALTVGAILFGGAAGVLGQDGGNLFWDNTAKRLGIGNAAPSVALDVTGAIKTSTTLTATTSVVTPLVQAASGAALNLGADGTAKYQIGISGSFLPVGDNTQNIGSNVARLANVFTPIIDSGTTGSLSLKTNNGTTGATIRNVASGINFLSLQSGAAGNPPIVSAIDSSETNVGVQLYTKGTGTFSIGSDVSGVAPIQFQVLHTASASRNITVTGSNGGNPTIGVTAGSLAITPAVVLGGALTMGGTLTMGANTLALATATVSGTPTWSSTQAMNISGSSASATGNAGTATALQNARTINGVSFDGTGNITVAAAAGTLTGATLASGVTASSLTSLGASAVWGTGVANFGTITKRKTADESVSNAGTGTTLQDDDHLTFAIAANEEWVVDYFVDAGAGITTTGYKLALTVPSGATLNFSHWPPGTTNGKRTTISGTALDYIAGSFTVSDPIFIHATAWILNGATPGNVNLQWAQSTASATNLTFRKGSHMLVTRVA